VDKDAERNTFAHPSDPTAWSPTGYDEFVAGMDHYEELHSQVVAVTLLLGATQVLELGTGTGEASSRILAAHPDAHLVAMDASPAMLEAAQRRLPPDRVSFVAGDIRDRLPEGLFDLIVSVLTVHHLDGDEKQHLYSKIAEHLVPGGAFVLGDIVRESRGSSSMGRLAFVLRQGVRRLRETAWRPPEIVFPRRRVPELSESAESGGAAIAAHVDRPERIDDQLARMAAAGLMSRSVWQEDGYAVLVGTRPVR